MLPVMDERYSTRNCRLLRLGLLNYDLIKIHILAQIVLEWCQRDIVYCRFLLHSVLPSEYVMCLSQRKPSLTAFPLFPSNPSFFSPPIFPLLVSVPWSDSVSHLHIFSPFLFQSLTSSVLFPDPFHLCTVIDSRCQ